MRTLFCLLPLLATAALAAEPAAGQAGEWFFLFSSDGNFVLLPSGRFQMDFIGAQGGAPAATFLPKRARLEAFGTLLKHVDFQLGAEFTFASAPVSTDNLVVLNFTRYAQLQIGQYDAPFSMDNRTSDKWFDLQERTNAVRAFAFPENKMTGVMAWGMPEEKWAYWSAGLFNGDGINAYPNKDDRFDFLGRAWLAPFGAAHLGGDLLRHVWVGASYWNGYHTPQVSQQIDRLAMKDQAGFTFFDTKGVGIYGQVTKWGLELNAPLGPFVAKAEYLHGEEGLREVASGAAKRRSSLVGESWYARLSYFPFGDPLINGLAGQQLPPHPLGEPKPSRTDSALQLVAQWDHVGFSYSANDGATAATDALVGDYSVDALVLGANYWWTRHVRFTVNFIRNWFGGPGPRPLAPDPTGSPRDTNFEITGRIAVAL